MNPAFSERERARVLHSEAEQGEKVEGGAKGGKGSMDKEWWLCSARSGSVLGFGQRAWTIQSCMMNGKVIIGVKQIIRA